MKRTWSDLGIKLPRSPHGDVKVLCPQCSHTRVHSPDETCLSVNVEKECFQCHHCGWHGYLNPGEKQENSFKWDDSDYDIPDVGFENWKLDAKTIKFFLTRGISKATLDANLIRSTKWKFDRDGDHEDAIAFPYIKGGDVVQIQFRALDEKKFKLVKGCQRPMYGLQHLIEDGHIASKKLFVCEGLIDKLAMYEAGYKFCLSVPNGSPFGEENSHGINPQPTALRFMDDADAQAVFDYVDEVVFTTDDDYPGRRLRDEMAKRIGVDKCRIVEWPKGCKDANDVLMRHGVEALIEAVSNSKSFPTSGIIELRDLKDNLFELQKTGITPGWSTGYSNLNQIFTVKPGYVSVTTGIPEVGKSTFWNNIAVNIAREYDIHIGLWSPENRPTEVHASSLMQIYSGKSFPKMNEREVLEAYEWVNNHFSWLSPEQPSMENLFDLAAKLVLKRGAMLFIFDPYASVIVDTKYGSEHQFVRELLTRSLDFVDKYKIHLDWVAHPTKLSFKEVKNPKEVAEWPIPNAYNISGSAHWFNKADFILSLWRSRKQGEYPIHVHVQKSKVKQVAKSREFRMFTYDEDTDLYLPFNGQPDERLDIEQRSERRVGEEGRDRGAPNH